MPSDPLDLQKLNRRLARKLERTRKNLAISEDLKEANERHLRSVISRMEQTEEELKQKNSALEQATQELLASQEEALRASAAKSMFLANMSHELRTPLNAIIGYSELLLEEEPVAALAQQEITSILGSGQHLLSLINDVLDLSKIEAGQMELVPHRFGLASLFEGLESTFRPSALRNGIALTLEVDAIPEVAFGDEARLRQILTNLMSNALKFTPDGFVQVRCAYAAGWLSVEIVDSGIGMTDQQMERVFRPFVQGDSTTTKRFGGTGLGLSICNRLVELWRGELSVESEVGVGTRFEVRLPLAAVPSVSGDGCSAGGVSPSTVEMT